MNDSKGKWGGAREVGTRASAPRWGARACPRSLALRPTLLLVVALLCGAPAAASEAVHQWLVKFAGAPSRYVGSPGHKATLDEVERSLRAFGIKEVRRERLTVTAPVEDEVWISGPGLGRVRLHAVWPNHVQLSATSRAGLTGPLVDAGHGEAEALDGGPVENIIALVRLPCAGGPQGWLTPFVLGASAVIFLPPQGAGFSRAEAEELFLDVAANLPRFWAPPRSVAPLLAAARRKATATLVSRMAWRDITTENIWGVLPGSDDRFPSADKKSTAAWKDKRVMFQAYTDSMSVVPALAPGAEETGGLIALMELAKHFSSHRVLPTLYFLATSGHGHVLHGSHEFLARHMRHHRYFTRSITAEEKLEVDYFIGLDLTSGSGQVASFSRGTFYMGWETNEKSLLVQNALAGTARLLDEHATKLYGERASAHYLNGVSPPTRSWKDLLGFNIAFDAEAAIVTGTPALTFATPFDARLRTDTPMDTMGKVDVPALSRQIQTLKDLLSSALADPEFFSEMKVKLPDTGRALIGEVHEFERTVTGLPDKPVAGALMVVRSGFWGRTKTYGPVRALHAVLSRQDDPLTLTVSETGTFRIPFLRLHEFWRWIWCSLEGYVIDADGTIQMSPDMGPITSKQFSTSIWFNEREKKTLQVLIRAQPFTILEPVNARQLRFLDKMMVQDGRDQPFMNFGFAMRLDQSSAQEFFSPAVVIFAPKMKGEDVRVKAFLSTGAFGVQSIFTGADEALLHQEPPVFDREEARGTGYPVSRGVLDRAPYEGAKDMWILNDARGRLLRRYHVRNFRIERLHEQGRVALQEARNAWAGKRYADFLAAARRAWGLEARAYPEYKTVANDLVKTVIFYCVLLVPFAFCMERLFFAFGSLHQQLLATGGIFLAGFLALRQVHPAFKISSNPIVIFLAFIILALGLFVLGIISTKFQRELRRMKGERGDYEAVDISRASATMAALVLGLSNLRRRPVRTALTVTTVVVLTFTVLSMVSMSSTIGFFRLPRGAQPPYAGALIRETAWQVLQPPTEDYLRSALESVARIVPRSWVTARSRGETLQLEVTAAGDRRTMVSGLLGLAPGEGHVLAPQRTIGLQGRWLEEGDRHVCLLPRTLADRLGVSSGGSVQIRGLALRVIGLFDGKRLSELKDLDGEALTPAKFMVRRARYDWEKDEPPKLAGSPDEGFQTTEHLSGEKVVIVPHALAMSLGGKLRSVAVVPRGSLGPDALVSRIKEFLVRAAVMALVSDGKETNLLTSVGAVSVKGTLDLLLPIFLVGLIVLNTMMGSVHERVREISIFSSVGLAPMHIGALFLAESFVVAIVGVVLGYLLAQVVAVVLLSTGTLAGLSLNYSSSAAVGACVLVIAAVMLSTLYPAKRAAELSVPDITRRWKLPKPQGDILDFDFPFTAGAADLVGLFTYLADLFRAYRDSSIGSFATDRVVLARTANGVVLTFNCWLAPYDLGISQGVKMEALPMELPGLYRIHLTLERRSGEAGAWYRQNRSFLTALRKRFLIWRMFGSELKTRYGEQGEAQMQIKHA